MSNVWLCIPAKRTADSTLPRWRERGYRIAVWLDEPTPEIEAMADLSIVGAYPGYAVACNRLIALVLKDQACDWAVCGGDDIDPDMAHSPNEIARQLTKHFRGTFGVMQPTGDRWGDDQHSRRRWPDAPAYIDRIAGSPWIGADFAKRVYAGSGPYWAGYWHNWLDEELKCVAENLGVYWPRRDLIHYHHHPLRIPGGHRPDFGHDIDAEYIRSKPVFARRQAAGFPGHEAMP